MALRSSLCTPVQRKEKQVKISEYKSYDDLPLFLNAATVAKVLGVSPSSGYELMHVVGTSSAFLASGQGQKLVRSTVPPLPTKPKDGFAGTPLDFPVLKVGSRMVVPKEKFVERVEQHTSGGSRR